MTEQITEPAPQATPETAPETPADHGAAAVFFDRDNTLIVGADYLGDPDGVVLMDGAADVVAGVRRLGYRVAVVSNQSGVARGYYTEADVDAVNARMDALLRAEDPMAIVDRHEFCPHHPEAEDATYGVKCVCRKPLPGMLRSAGKELGLDLRRSWMVGDAPRDIDAGAAAGCRTILVTVPSIEQSPAAAMAGKAAPDFTAASLAEVLDIIRREYNRPAPLPAAPVEATTPPPAPREDPSTDRIAQTTAAILADLRRHRETSREDFSVFRLLAGVVQVLALSAFAWGLVFEDPRGLPSAIFLQVLTLTLLVAGRNAPQM